MDNFAKRWPRFTKYASYTGIFIGFAGMLLTVVFLVISLIGIFKGKTDAGVAIVQPFVQTELGSPFFFVPITYFIITIFIIAIIHEFSHGIVARLFKVRIKSSGFAFFSIFIPIIPAAFVEPDEKQVAKLSPMKQLAIFAAGPFSNILLAIVILGVIFAINPLLAGITQQDVLIINYTESDITLPAELTGVGLGEAIIQVDNTIIESSKDFTKFMKTTKPNQEVTLQTNTSTYSLTLAEHPTNAKQGYMGVFVYPHTYYDPDFKEKYGFFIPIIQWVMGLLILLVMFNIGIGLINLAPLGPLDGGRMLLTLLRTIFKEKTAITLWSQISLVTLVILLGTMFLPSILKFI